MLEKKKLFSHSVHKNKETRIINQQNNGPILLPGVTLEQLKTIRCSCGSEVFQQGLIFRKAGALVTASGIAQILPFSTFYCIKCGEFFKEEIDEENNED